MFENLRKKYFCTEIRKDESVFIERIGHASIEMKFVGVTSANMAKISFELPSDIMIRKEEKAKPRKVRTL